MQHAIPKNPEEISALRRFPVSEELLAVAIAGVVSLAKRQGQSLEDLSAEVMAEDTLLDGVQRRWLQQIIRKAWAVLP
ncbi:MAG: hypothetical protein ACK5CA_16910 [Cyanobacteriota bacterium]|jgi:lambda repressor-like predicted transcriptional regulator